MGNRQQGKTSKRNSQANFRATGADSGDLDLASGTYLVDLAPGGKIVVVNAFDEQARKFFRNPRVVKDLLAAIKEEWPSAEELQVR